MKHLRSHILQNGFRYITIPKKNTRICSIVAVNENKKNGDLLEHVLFSNKIKRSNYKFLESLGAVYNAYTSVEYTCYYLTVPYKKANDALIDVLDMLFNLNVKILEI